MFSRIWICDLADPSAGFANFQATHFTCFDPDQPNILAIFNLIFK